MTTLTRIVIAACNAVGYLVGESHGKARHCDDVVTRARKMYEAGVGYRCIGKTLGVPRSTVQSWVGQSGNARRNTPAVRVKSRRVQSKTV